MRATEGELIDVADPTGWLTLRLPASWTAQLFDADPDPACDNVDAAATLSDPDDPVRADLSIGVWRCERAGGSIESFTERFVAEFVDDGELVSDEAGTVGGREARIVRARQSVGGQGALFGVQIDGGFLLVQVYYPGDDVDPRYDAVVALLASTVRTGPLD